MKEILQILNMRISYDPHWVGIDDDGKLAYDDFEIGGCHEIEAKHFPADLYTQVVMFVKKVEQAHSERGS
jgi:hypothetical protein